MKKRIVLISVAALLAVLALVMLFAGCSPVYCSYCTGTALKSCVACGLEGYGHCSDCASIGCNIFMGEDCTDRCYVAPCYNMAEIVRTCNCEACTDISSGINPLSDMNRLGDPEEYEIDIEMEYEEISHLESYYRMKLIFTVEAKVDMKDVMITFGFRDNNGNRHQEMLYYFARSIRAGEEKTETITLTLSYDDADSITPEEEGYFFELTDLALYAKIKE